MSRTRASTRPAWPSMPCCAPPPISRTSSRSSVITDYCQRMKAVDGARHCFYKLYITPRQWLRILRWTLYAALFLLALLRADRRLRQPHDPRRASGPRGRLSSPASACARARSAAALFALHRLARSGACPASDQRQRLPARAHGPARARAASCAAPCWQTRVSAVAARLLCHACRRSTGLILLMKHLLRGRRMGAGRARSCAACS